MIGDEVTRGLNPDNPEYVSAKVELLKAQTIGQQFDNRMSAALAATAEIAANRDERQSRWELAAASHRRIYYFGGEIGASTALSAIDTLGRWEQMDREDGLTDRPYKILLCSPGGDVVHGYQLFSYLRGLAERRTLTISASGLCASMATIIHQAASDGCRVVEPGCSYLLHEVSGGVGGRFDSIADTADWMKQLNENMYEIFAERSPYDAEEIKQRVSRREKFLTPAEVVEWGLADRIEYTS